MKMKDKKAEQIAAKKNIEINSKPKGRLSPVWKDLLVS